MSAKFKAKLAKVVDHGGDVHMGMKQAVTTKAKNDKKPQRKMKAVKESKSKKGLQK